MNPCLKLILPLLALLQLLLAAPAHADTQALLDRTRIALGESVALTIETDQLAAVPDLSPLARDFDLSGQSSSRQMQMGPGGLTRRTTHVVNLTPRRVGVLQVGPIEIGAQRTPALTVTVDALPLAAPTSRADTRVFLETEIDHAAPYVQQSVGVTVRLFYAVPLASGQLDLDTPEGTSLQRVGEDVQSSREVDGRRFNVVERRFLMIPERSGPLTVPAPRFAGRGAGGWMDDFLGGNSREMRAAGSQREITVRPQPDGAPQPWLPLRDLRLRYVGAPQALRAGEAATLVVEAQAIGATQAQMPELQGPSVAGAQVFAEPAQFDEGFEAGSPRVTLTRRYSIVPNAAGTLRIPGLQVSWWDVRTGAARTASLPDLSLPVAAGSGSFDGTRVVDAPAGIADDDSALAFGQAESAVSWPGWMWVSLALAALWLATLGWALRTRHRAPAAVGERTGTGTSYSPGPTHSAVDLKRALDAGTLDEVGIVLCGMATPPASDLDALQALLEDPRQRAALKQLQRARWADGDGVAARSALRAAFDAGPRWQARAPAATEPLPPLYPQA